MRFSNDEYFVKIDYEVVNIAPRLHFEVGTITVAFLRPFSVGCHPNKMFSSTLIVI